MDEKTIRWPGHVDQLKTLIECGLFDTTPVEFNNRRIVPRKFISKLLSDKLMLGKDRDLTLLRVDVTGKKGNRQVHRRYEMIDHYDAKHGTTSMARTTAFPCSIAAQILGSCKVAAKGVCPPELAFKNELREEFLGYLKRRGLRIISRTT
jgi:saccharopine dehydrogenase-like NADP-dependent oxidoreductase